MSTRFVYLCFFFYLTSRGTQVEHFMPTLSVHIRKNCFNLPCWNDYVVWNIWSLKCINVTNFFFFFLLHSALYLKKLYPGSLKRVLAAIPKNGSQARRRSMEMETFSQTNVNNFILSINMSVYVCWAIVSAFILMLSLHNYKNANFFLNVMVNSFRIYYYPSLKKKKNNNQKNLKYLFYLL